MKQADLSQMLKTHLVVAEKIASTDTENGKEYIVIHTNGVNPSSRGAIDLTGYTLYLDTLNKLSGELTTVTPEAFQTIIASKAL